MQQTVFSVFFQPCDATRPFVRMDRQSGYAQSYHIDAAPPGEYRMLVVDDCMERQYVIEQKYMDTPVFADGLAGIARDLVNQWAANVLGPGGDVGPGLFQYDGNLNIPAAGKVSDVKSPALRGMLERALARQTRWAEWMVLTAEEDWLRGNKTNIQSAQRQAAIWLGREDLEWVKPPERAILSACPYCTKPINSMAVVCPNCRNVIDNARFQQLQSKLQAVQERLATVGPQVPEELPPDPLAVTPVLEPEPVAVGAPADPESGPLARPLQPPLTKQTAVA